MNERTPPPEVKRLGVDVDLSARLTEWILCSGGVSAPAFANGVGTATYIPPFGSFASALATATTLATAAASKKIFDSLPTLCPFLCPPTCTCHTFPRLPRRLPIVTTGWRRILGVIPVIEVTVDVEVAVQIFCTS